MSWRLKEDKGELGRFIMNQSLVCISHSNFLALNLVKEFVGRR